MIELTASTYAQCAEFIKQEEGLRLQPYICPGGMKTVGYGHALKPTDSVKEITEEAALAILRDDIADALKTINACVFAELAEPQIIALCSFVFNVGAKNFRSSTLLKKLNAGASIKDVADEFHRWNKVNGTVVLNGLTKRRSREAALFLTAVPVEEPIAPQKKEERDRREIGIWEQIILRFMELRKKI